MSSNAGRQAELDEMTFNMYVDCGLSASETAHQQGISASTVRARVRRHVRRLHPPAYVSHLSAETEATLARIALEASL
jgi:DNA-binding NarL/FixJ family response regulator